MELEPGDGGDGNKRHGRGSPNTYGLLRGLGLSGGPAVTSL